MFHFTTKDMMLDEQHRRELLHDAEQDRLAQLASASHRSFTHVAEAVRKIIPSIVRLLPRRTTPPYQRARWVHRRAH